MFLSHETPSAVRQPCPDSAWGARTLVVLALLLGAVGCRPSNWHCDSAEDCAPGLTCVYWAPGGGEEMRYCAQACPVEADTCDNGMACRCPDSPAKQRCFDDKGTRIGVCEPR